jgi:putative hemin transport protein
MGHKLAMTDHTPFHIRAFVEDFPKMRARDLADKLGISEGELIAAHVGHGAHAIKAHPDNVMAAAQELGEVMALTRNASCVHERVGTYLDYHSGQHACMVLGPDIDLRMFPSQWQHAFMVEKETERGVQRSIQVFDGAGDAVHKVFLRDGSDLRAWDRLKAGIVMQDAPDRIEVGQRQPTEAPKANKAKVDILRAEWQKLTDTHQFLRLCSKLKMNRLGAYRIAGAPFVRQLDTAAVDQMLLTLSQDGTEVMLFVGNRGCIQIHMGGIETVKPMGPWQNVLDPMFNLHLRLDHVAEVWAVDKPTQRGKAVSVEAFDAEGMLIFQVFGVPKEGRDSRPAWQSLVETLPSVSVSEGV